MNKLRSMVIHEILVILRDKNSKQQIINRCREDGAKEEEVKIVLDNLINKLLLEDIDDKDNLIKRIEKLEKRLSSNIPRGPTVYR